MSDVLIGNLQAEINRLNQRNAELAAEAKDRRLKGRAAIAEAEELRGQVAALTAERDGFRAKAEATPGEASARIAELEGALRSRDHKDAFAAVREFDVPGEDGTPHKYTLAEGVKPEAVWQLTGYKAEGETPDARSVAARYGEALHAHPFLFRPVATATGETPTTAPGGAPQPISVVRREGGPGARTSTPTNAVQPSAIAAIDAAHGARPAGRLA